MKPARRHGGARGIPGAEARGEKVVNPYGIKDFAIRGEALRTRPAPIRKDRLRLAAAAYLPLDTSKTALSI